MTYDIDNIFFTKWKKLKKDAQPQKDCIYHSYKKQVKSERFHLKEKSGQQVADHPNKRNLEKTERSWLIPMEHSLLLKEKEIMGGRWGTKLKSRSTILTSASWSQDCWPWPLVYPWGHDLKKVHIQEEHYHQQQHISQFYDLFACRK